MRQWDSKTVSSKNVESLNQFFPISEIRHPDRRSLWRDCAGRSDSSKQLHWRISGPCASLPSTLRGAWSGANSSCRARSEIYGTHAPQPTTREYRLLMIPMTPSHRRSRQTVFTRVLLLWGKRRACRLMGFCRIAAVVQKVNGNFECTEWTIYNNTMSLHVSSSV